MAVFQQRRLQFPDLGGDHLAHMVDVVILGSGAVGEEEEDLTTGGPTMIEEPVEASPRVSGGGAKHHLNGSPVMVEEEEEVVEGQTATGMDEAGEDGDLLCLLIQKLG
jgi:hypothetical protein